MRERLHKIFFIVALMFFAYSTVSIDNGNDVVAVIDGVKYTAYQHHFWLMSIIGAAIVSFVLVLQSDWWLYGVIFALCVGKVVDEYYCVTWYGASEFILQVLITICTLVGWFHLYGKHRLIKWVKKWFNIIKNKLPFSHRKVA